MGSAGLSASSANPWLMLRFPSCDTGLLPRYKLKKAFVKDLLPTSPTCPSQDPDSMHNVVLPCCYPLRLTRLPLNHRLLPVHLLDNQMRPKFRNNKLLGPAYLLSSTPCFCSCATRNKRSTYISVVYLSCESSRLGVCKGKLHSLPELSSLKQLLKLRQRFCVSFLQ